MAPHSFQAFWTDLPLVLKPGTEIRGWGKARGYTDLRFRVIDLDAGSVTIDSATVSAPRRISRGEFEKLFALWDRYCAGQISRQEVTPISQNSSYIFAILRWYGGSAMGR